MVHFFPDKGGVCCDAFNINHIQSTGRTQSSVYQLESAHASGVGYELPRSVIPLASDPLIIAGAVSVAALVDLYFSSAHRNLKLGLETFQHHFFRGQRSR